MNHHFRVSFQCRPVYRSILKPANHMKFYVDIAHVIVIEYNSDVYSKTKTWLLKTIQSDILALLKVKCLKKSMYYIASLK